MQNLLNARQSTRHYHYIWLPLCAAAIFLGFPNNFTELPFLVLLWPVGTAAIAINSPAKSDAFIKAWGAGFVGCFAALYWLYMPLSEVAELPFAAALLCAASIACCLSSQGAFFALLVWFTRSYAVWGLCVILPLGWYFLELIYAKAAGFPWLPLSGALIQWPVMMQGASMTGAWLWGALWLVPSFLIYFALSCRYKPGRLLISAVFCIILMAGLGIWQIQSMQRHPVQAKSCSALIVEGNIDQNQKWEPVFQKYSLETYINLTGRALESEQDLKHAVDLIIWPETALPFFFQRSGELASLTENAVRNWRLPLLFGAPGVEMVNGTDAVFNRAFLMNPEGRIIGIYDKEQLVPFGEYLPVWLDFDFLKPLLQGVGVYHKGFRTKPLKYQDIALGLLICYEGIFPWLAQERVREGANVLVDISNDGWFGDSPAARQHLLLTALRSIEQNRWIIRATNTGISAAIDPHGRITASGKMFQAEYLLFNFEIKNDLTFFNRNAAAIPWVCLGILCFVTVLAHKRHVR